MSSCPRALKVKYRCGGGAGRWPGPMGRRYLRAAVALHPLHRRMTDAGVERGRARGDGEARGWSCDCVWCTTESDVWEGQCSAGLDLRRVRSGAPHVILSQSQLDLMSNGSIWNDTSITWSTGPPVRNETSPSCSGPRSPSLDVEPLTRRSFDRLPYRLSHMYGLGSKAFLRRDDGSPAGMRPREGEAR